MKSNNKGFTIAEIVIALTIIAFVTLTATSLVMVSIRISKNTRDRLLAVNLCNNSIVIFQSLCDSSSEDLYESFKERFIQIYSQNKSDEYYSEQKYNSCFTIHFDNNWQILSKNELSSSKFECEFTFNIDENNKNPVTFIIKVSYCQVDIDDVISPGIEQIYSATYTSISEANQ